MKNSLMTFSLKGPSVTFSTVGINTFDIHEKHDLNREIRKTRGFMKTQGFRPSLAKSSTKNACDRTGLFFDVCEEEGWRKHSVRALVSCHSQIANKQE